MRIIGPKKPARKDCFPIWGDWVSIAFDENRTEDTGLGRAGSLPRDNCRFATPSYRHGEASIAGKRAEDFTMELSGKPSHLSDFRGKVVVLNFWATWCPPCIEETPALNRLQKYIESRNALVLGVSVDEDPVAYETFLKDHGVVFPTFREPTRKLALDYGTSRFPDTYVIDRHGKILRKFFSSQQWDSPDMLAYFDAVLGQT
jgi:cytochrome c biogenesis protein CcmG/thiol:disulfide interchange protein DsbE